MDKKQIYEGKAKVLFEGPEEGQIIQYFKDDATAFNKQKFDVIEGKGVLNNIISAYMMEFFSKNGIENHFIERLNKREQLVKKVEIVPVEVVLRNYAAGTLVKRYGLEDGIKLSRPLIEFCYKSDEHGDPLLSEEHILIFNFATQDEIDMMKKTTLIINQILGDLFDKIGIILGDFKVEFGRVTENGSTRLILADEMSPDNCRLWDKETLEIMDKDRFRKGLGSLTEFYREVAVRLGLEKELEE